jgi:CelD/BcsL family acetyltransferase involved in cellulose biosynthesis
MLLERETSMDLAIEEIHSPDRANGLRAEWTALWKRSPNATPFQRPEWQLAWWDVFGRDKELRLISFRETRTSRLVALLPAMILPQENKMMFVGAAVSDELDILAEPEFTEAAAQAFLTIACNGRHRWAECELAPLPETSPFRSKAAIDDVTPIVDLSQPIPANMRHNLRHYRRRAERIGSVEFESGSQENFEQLFGALIDLHCTRWNRRNEPGVLCDDAVKRFHRQAAHALLRRGITRIYALRISGRIVAVFYGLLCRGQMRSYIGGFHPDLKQLSLGTLIIGHAIEQAKREGAHEFNFLRGGEAYKRHWGAKDRYVYSRRLAAEATDAR